MGLFQKRVLIVLAATFGALLIGRSPVAAQGVVITGGPAETTVSLDAEARAKANQLFSMYVTRCNGSQYVWSYMQHPGDPNTIKVFIELRGMRYSVHGETAIDPANQRAWAGYWYISADSSRYIEKEHLEKGWSMWDDVHPYSVSDTLVKLRDSSWLLDGKPFDEEIDGLERAKLRCSELPD